MFSITFRELMRRHFGVEIGPYSYGPALFPGGLPDGTQIGSYCSLAAGILVFRRNHPTRRIAQHPFFYNSALKVLPSDSIHADRDNPLTVGSDTWIGSNVIITPRCKTIGIGAVVGAGAVVTADVAPYSIVGGNPARQIGERFSVEVQQVLTACRWWDYPIARLTPCLSLFLEGATLEGAQRLQAHLGKSAP